MARSIAAWTPQRLQLRRELKKAGMSQGELGRRIGLGPQHMSRMLSGQYVGRMWQWAAAADALGMAWWLTPMDPNAPLTAWVKEHLDIELEPWQAERLRRIVRDRA